LPIVVTWPRAIPISDWDGWHGYLQNLKLKLQRFKKIYWIKIDIYIYIYTYYGGLLL
jgi:homogentisate 1,2-dioxygenase